MKDFYPRKLEVVLESRVVRLKAGVILETGGRSRSSAREQRCVRSVMKPSSCDGRVKTEVTVNGYGDCPDLAEIGVDRVNASPGLDRGRVGARYPAKGPAQGLNL